MLPGFSDFRLVQGRTSIADAFARTRRCGVYILRFGNGELYVGQAVDVCRRYAQHVAVHDDIESIPFQRLPRKSLTDVERGAVHQLERDGHRLRNITFASTPIGESDFDLVMPPKAQERWVAETEGFDLTGTRAVAPELRRRYERRFKSFSELPGADGVFRFARQYVQTCIPVPIRSELAFWSCSCLPTGRTFPRGAAVWVRINVHWQVTLSLSEFDGELVGSFHLARSPLQSAFGPTFRRLRKAFPGMVEIDNLLEPGGQDQTNLYIREHDLDRFLAQPEVVSAIRLFNMRLMRKGPCAYGRYHCLDLADKLLEP